MPAFYGVYKVPDLLIIMQFCSLIQCYVDNDLKNCVSIFGKPGLGIKRFDYTLSSSESALFSCSLNVSRRCYDLKGVVDTPYKNSTTDVMFCVLYEKIVRNSLTNPAFFSYLLFLTDWSRHVSSWWSSKETKNLERISWNSPN